MSRAYKTAFLVAVTLAAAACAESTGPNPSVTSVNAAFGSLLAGYSNTQNSFSASADSMKPWGPGDHDGDHEGMMDGHRGRHGPGFGGMGFGMPGGMMGGGLGDVFRGEGLGHGFAGLTSGTETHDGLTITRAVTFADVNGGAQQAFDSITTNTINQQVSVTGTITRRDGATSTVSHQSNRTVSGLARGSTQRTVNGTSAGTENTAGTDSTGAFTVARAASDTTSNVVIPVSTSAQTHPYPTAGKVVRNMKVVVTRAGSTTTSTRREVVTYDGTSTAQVEITQDGTTKPCTVALPHGRLTCS